jgi:hypothetical protein
MCSSTIQLTDGAPRDARIAKTRGRAAIRWSAL